MSHKNKPGKPAIQPAPQTPLGEGSIVVAPAAPDDHKPDEAAEKHFAKQQTAHQQQYEAEQKTRSARTRDPGHPYEHHGDRISDTGSKR